MQPRDISNPVMGHYLIERVYGMEETKPRLVKDREFVTCSIYAEYQPDDSVILCAEIDGKTVDVDELWTRKLYDITEEEYHRRRGL